MALDHAVRQGKALYAGISSYSASKTREAAAIARELGTPLLIHQPSYSLLNRWIEEDLLDELEEQGMGTIVFSALAQGLLTDRYLDGIPADSRRARGSTIRATTSTSRPCGTSGSSTRSPRPAEKLAQMALQWALRDRASPRPSSAPARSSSSANIDALSGPAFTPRSSRRSTTTPSTPASTSGPSRPRTRPGRGPPSKTARGTPRDAGECSDVGHVDVAEVRYELPDGRVLLDDVSFGSARAPRSRWSGPTGRARPRSCGSSPRTWSRTPAPSPGPAGSG